MIRTIQPFDEGILDVTTDAPWAHAEGKGAFRALYIHPDMDPSWLNDILQRTEWQPTWMLGVWEGIRVKAYNGAWYDYPLNNYLIVADDLDNASAGLISELRSENQKLQEALEVLMREASPAAPDEGYFDFLIDNFFMLGGSVAKTLKRIYEEMQ